MRLIDADSLVEFIDNNSIAIDENYEKTYNLKQIQKLLDHTPTAYDVDRVVRELQNYVNKCNDEYIKTTNPMKESFYSELGIAISKAIQIVKAGGKE